MIKYLHDDDVTRKCTQIITVLFHTYSVILSPLNQQKDVVEEIAKGKKAICEE
jgi:hypothetical protein